ncbi:unnamed protein product [Rodentolepis nana]|uniref:HTH_48 domain-containing protein n=1 Tax=Rodentolepis nana TaxID=102285 RepID=A0A0R3TQW9_RODNA|nr:unnamed protein product [Rodentolepis nana]
MDIYGLLKYHEINGLGGIDHKDIAKCVKDADKVVKSLGDTVLAHTNKRTKKRVIYFNDARFDLRVGTDLVEMWRSVCVEGVSRNQVQDYLTKHGLTKMSGDEPNRPRCEEVKKCKLPNRRPRRQVDFKSKSHVNDTLFHVP